MKKVKKEKQNIFFQHKKLFFGLLFLLSTILIFLPIFFQIKFKEFAVLGLFGTFIANFLGSATLFIPSPAIFSVGIAGNMYNPFLVALIASIGSSLGESVGFLFGYSSKEVIGLKKHKIIYTLNNFIFQKYGSFAVFMFSLIPNPFFDGIGILVGMSSFSLKRFLFLVFVGRFIRNLAIASFGARL